MKESVSKDILLSALRESNQRAESWFQDIPGSDFFKRQGGVWSPSDNLDHMIKAVRPITKALKLPKVTLQAMFGKAEKPSMIYEELCRIYREAIANGGQASGRYLPEQKTPSDEAENEKEKLLVEWRDASDELVSMAEKWQESDLDQYQLPHPLLGKLAVREMLYFTIYHNVRHASQERD